MKFAITVLLALRASGVYSFKNITQVNALHHVTINVTAATDNTDQYDCPLPCISHTNPDTWTTYQSDGRLRRCQKPMLLQLSRNNTIHCCTVDESRPAAHRMENLDAAYREPGKESVSACNSNGIEVPGKVLIAHGSDGGRRHASEAAKLLEYLQAFFEDPYNCFHDSFFAHGKRIAVSVWSGGALAKPTIVSALRSLAKRLKANGSMSFQTVVELCDSSRSENQIFGIAVDSVENLRRVQRIALGWSRGDSAASMVIARRTYARTGSTVQTCPGPRDPYSARMNENMELGVTATPGTCLCDNELDNDILPHIDPGAMPATTQARQPNYRIVEMRPGGHHVLEIQKKCRVPPAKATLRLGPAKNTLRLQSCVHGTTQKKDLIITSVVYADNAQPTQIAKECDQAWDQACFHYSSAVRVNPQWATLTCPPEAATTVYRRSSKAADTWTKQHNGGGWTDVTHRAHKRTCVAHEYPPAYLLGSNDPAAPHSGLYSQGQLIRYIPGNDSQQAAHMWKGVCFGSVIKDIPNSEFRTKVDADKNKQVTQIGTVLQVSASVTVELRPEFTISKWGHAGNPPQNDGLNDNPCWPSAIAMADPGFAVLDYDTYYDYNPRRPYDYKAPYARGQNGV
ncbi:hypothetical protein LY76DRAFT_658737 [Colletotrichum caudatum]|nr:hypothetical protein LY76DRAFT_658737 [Colletotrichum caudatum]